MLALFILILTVLQVLGQHGFQPSITCYTKYEHEENKIRDSNQVLSYSYHQAHIKNYATKDGELCSKIGCACFSYRGICSHTSLGSNHYSQCTDEDRQNRIIKWHHGWSSHSECEQMRQNPQTYLDLTCCYSDHCNDQPGKITKIVDTPTPLQYQHPMVYEVPQPIFVSHKPTHRYVNDREHSFSNTLPPHKTPRLNQHYDRSTPRPNQHYDRPTPRPNQHYDRSTPKNHSYLSHSFSYCLIFFACILVLI